MENDIDVKIVRDDPEAVYEIVNGVYCPISSTSEVTGVHRELVQALLTLYHGQLLEVCDLDGGELYFGVSATGKFALNRMVTLVTDLMKKHNPDWDGNIFLVNTIKKYQNPLDVKAWNMYYFTITLAPHRH